MRGRIASILRSSASRSRYWPLASGAGEGERLGGESGSRDDADDGSRSLSHLEASSFFGASRETDGQKETTPLWCAHMTEGQAPSAARPSASPPLVRKKAFAAGKRSAAPAARPPAARPPVPTPEEAAAVVIEAKARGYHDRSMLRRQKTAAIQIEKYARGRVTRSQKRLPVPRARHEPPRRKLGRPLRVVVCGCDWSGASEQARWLASALDVACVQPTGEEPSVPPTECDESSWVLDGADATAALVGALQALAQPPTHWVLCTADDEVLEARGVAEAMSLEESTLLHERSASPSFTKSLRGRAPLGAYDSDEEAMRAAVRERLREWKVRMVDVYAELPASAFGRFDTGGTNRRATAELAHKEIADAVLRGSRPAAAASEDVDEAPRGGARHLEERSRQRSAKRSGASTPAGGRMHDDVDDEAAAPAQTTEGDASLAEPQAGGAGGAGGTSASASSQFGSATPRRMLLRELAAASTTAVQALERVDDATANWTAHSLLARLSKFSTELVREMVPLDGRVLISIHGANLAPALTAAWPQPAKLRCLVSVVDGHGLPLAEAGEARTASVECAPLQPEVWWGDELGLSLPRAVLSRSDARVQLTLYEDATGSRLALASRPLLDVVSQSVQPRSWDKLDEDWRWVAIGASTGAVDVSDAAAGDGEGVHDPFAAAALSRLPSLPASPFAPTYLATHSAAGRSIGYARVRVLVIDVVGAFDELMLFGRQEAANLRMMSEELDETEAKLDATARANAELRWQMNEMRTNRNAELEAYAARAVEEALRKKQEGQCTISTQTLEKGLVRLPKSAELHAAAAALPARASAPGAARAKPQPGGKPGEKAPESPRSKRFRIDRAIFAHNVWEAHAIEQLLMDELRRDDDARAMRRNSLEARRNSLEKKNDTPSRYLLPPAHKRLPEKPAPEPKKPKAVKPPKAAAPKPAPATEPKPAKPAPAAVVKAAKPAKDAKAPKAIKHDTNTANRRFYEARSKTQPPPSLPPSPPPSPPPAASRPTSPPPSANKARPRATGATGASSRDDKPWRSPPATTTGSRRRPRSRSPPKSRSPSPPVDLDSRPDWDRRTKVDYRELYGDEVPTYGPHDERSLSTRIKYAL